MKRVIKFVILLISAVSVLLLLCGNARAEDIGEYGESIADALPSDVSDVLEGAGITPDNNGAAGLSLDGVLGYAAGLFTEKAAAPLKLLAALCGTVLLCTLSKSISDGAGNMSGVFSVVGVLAGAGIASSAIYGVISEVLSVLQSASRFMLVFVPVFAGVIAAMGRATAASAANTVILAAAQLFSQLASNFLVPICGTVMGLSVTGAVYPELSLGKLGEFIKKAAVWSLSFIMTIFMGILSAQTFVANSADSVLIKTAKFAVSSGVPIVGGTISDAVNTVSASLSLFHSSVGTYGIIAGAAIILPMLISVICYRLALSAAEAVSGIFGINELTELFKACGAVMAIITAVTVCFLLLNTVSAAIMLAAARGG